MIDILFVSYNRLLYTREALHALMENTEWEHVRRLVIADDNSTDGTREGPIGSMGMYWAATPAHAAGTELAIVHEAFGGPVAATNMYLERYSDGVDVFAKIDNDFIVCPGWLGEMLRVMAANPWVDILGTEPFTGGPTPIGDPDRRAEKCRHIGGKGLMKVSAWDGRPMWADGRQGFTQWQERNEAVVKAWLTPDIATFGLDQLPHEPWPTISRRYEEIEVDGRPMHRTLGFYPAAEQYSAWWTPAFPVVIP